MTAKTPAQRQAEKRERDKLDEEERLARLLATRLTLDLYHGEHAALQAGLSRADITEPQDLLSRYIRGAARLNDQAFAELIRNP